MRLEDIAYKYGDTLVEVVDQKIRELCSESPDFQYNPFGQRCGCFYDGPSRLTRDGKTVATGPECSGCIFGQAFQRLGWDDKAQMGYGGSIEAMAFGIMGTKAPHYWPTIQIEQDEGAKWGKLLEHLPGKKEE